MYYKKYREAVEALKASVGDDVLYNDGSTDWKLSNLLSSIDDDARELSAGGYFVDEGGISERSVHGGFRGRRILKVKTD
ncbi:MAG: hypothetical protein GXX95_01485 [Methanomassiliicoccus sp.]|nr:hypothetical protein [Methanomassiliicoccus sp.]